MFHFVRTYRTTLGPLHSPPSGGRFFSAASNCARWAPPSLDGEPLFLRPSVNPSGPCSFHLLRTSRVVMTDSPTTSATGRGADRVGA
jgi:hypothetical protein